MTTGHLVRVEKHRGRVSLGRVADVAPGDLFQVTVEPDGAIILRPVRVVNREPDGPGGPGA